jgi:type I restriction enzyme S subunit
LSEQKSIVKLLQRIIEEVDEIETQKSEVLSLVSIAKSKILDLAIRGKLVPQDPADEPASVLLERIRAEKKELIRQGKIKRDKKESVIFKAEDSAYYEKNGTEVRCINEEIPFELPDTWEWARMKNMMQIISGVTYDKSDISTSGIRILRGGNLLSDQTVACFSDDVFLPPSYKNASNQIHVGDIVIVASTGSSAVIGKPAFVDNEMPLTQIGGFLRIVRPVNALMAAWLRVIFLTNYYHTAIVALAKGTNINNVKAGYLEELLVPVPTTSELQQIVDRVKAILNSVGSIEKSLN